MNRSLFLFYLSQVGLQVWSYYLPFVSALFAKEKANNHLKLENISFYQPLKIKKMQTRLYENKILVQLIFNIFGTWYIL